MPIESASYISQLVATNPTGTDDYATADDHLRLVKSVLASQFPNFLAVAMTASVSELNILDGVNATTAELNKLAGTAAGLLPADLDVLAGGAAAGITPTEFAFLNGVTSAIQTQLDGKANTAHNHPASEITSGVLAAARIPTHTGEVTGQTALTIANGAVTLARMANMVTASFLGRATAGTGTPEVLSASAARSILNVENGATADQSNTEIRTAVGNAADSNIFTDVLLTKLNGIENAATADQSAAEIRAAVDAASDSNVFTNALLSKLNGIENSATADQTNTEIRTAVGAATDSNVFTDALLTKLNGIATGAEVNVDEVSERTFSANSTLVLGDAAGVTRSTGATNVSMTIPPNSSVAFALGTVIGGERYGTGTFVWAPGTGVTIRSPGSLLGHRVQYSPSSIRKIGTNEWMLGGDLV